MELVRKIINFMFYLLFSTGDFAEKLPDFQMMEIMQYIVTLLPTLNQDHEEETQDSRFILFKIYIYQLFF
jgi:hypothetical protein